MGKPKVFIVSAVLLTAAFYSVLPGMDTSGMEDIEAGGEHHTGRVLLTIKSFQVRLPFVMAKLKRSGPVLTSLHPLLSCQSSKSIAGYAIGCISGLMYCTSRIPQIIKNVSGHRTRCSRF